MSEKERVRGRHERDQEKEAWIRETWGHEREREGGRHEKEQCMRERERER